MRQGQHKILVLFEGKVSVLGSHVKNFFDAECVGDLKSAFQKLTSEDIKVVVYDCADAPDLKLSVCESLLADDLLKKIPLIVLTKSYSIQDKLKAFEIGCDDFLDATISGDEACARVTKSIFHRIANDQLASRLEVATETARTAMVDNSDLGANIQFLLAVHNCDNLDQLGQQFFATIERYGLRCSLQMRSSMGEKNMEAHGMAKDLESQLLSQLSDAGRYIDFGSRTIVNYDRVSLLIKNMPVGDDEKYGVVKDNTFSLMQGMNARILALEDKHRLLEEKESLKKLSADVGGVMSNVQNSYQQVMRDIVNEVENCSELIQNRVPHLALTEVDEKFLDEVAERVVRETNRIFNEGLVVDYCLEQLEAAIDRALKSVDANEESGKPDDIEQSKSQTSSIELF